MDEPMNPLQKLFYAVVYVVSLVIIHPLLFVWRYARYIVTNAAAVARAVWRRVRGGR